MSGIEGRERELEGEAFEYVAGSLSPEERSAFELRLQSEPELGAELRFWEEQLMSMQTSEDREPLPGAWQAIEKRIQPQVRQQEAPRSFWKFSALGFAMAWMLTLAVFFAGNTQAPLPSQPNSDYVAVLTGDSGEALLTALTSADGEQLWLKWEGQVDKGDGSLQLWAQSRRDGQVRPLVVFDELQQSLLLDEATYRLIRDSSHLLLTREEEGGSAIDEPSEELIAKGVCVRLDEANPLS
jgi:anti-sigma-K factor RskA